MSNKSQEKQAFMQGNIAAGEGAIAAGADVFAGYPITPSSEIAQHASVNLPKLGGMYVQMEDEIGSISAVVGASMAGAKTYTATSGPGISLMNENIGLACMVEAPCVIINVQRVGPSTGLATKPAQGDLMQTRWGTHGDHGVIAVSPASVQECFDLTVQAFNFAERFRTPVFVLMDGLVGQMYETITIPEEVEIEDRKLADCPPEEFEPYAYDEDLVPSFAPYGGERINKANGSGHGLDGYPDNSPENYDMLVNRLVDKIENKKEEICLYETYQCEDAEVLIITYGCSVRSGLTAVEKAREEGIKAGLLQLKTVWPFPDHLVKEYSAQVDKVIVPELSLGQLKAEVNKYVNDVPVIGVNKNVGLPITPQEIIAEM
ncbi:2-oxoacid:acceptor oxidoreductase subunit alpha [Acetohalobium arabaticum]|uniref:2-oxoglutarate ferredoxin oxidoreductase, alpha subunit n=1 Tax=Acetohalobium arabaticum (strain ATCC 49924 / DSM 5501 / Z-7288) TaxID=574087 RepID=D9QUU1_ACEAZ|nr:2-oxoacid:acceptor oxidoreductase subunit alpha [Acetohalobium arabaticum]ADL12000.1 2-oxoglutarate ferredoxin oxidoreductase, alpha subunit [Acetohalobium arabaticum DSM 5501]